MLLRVVFWRLGAGIKLSKYVVRRCASFSPSRFSNSKSAYRGFLFFTRVVLGLENAESGDYGSVSGTVLYV